MKGRFAKTTRFIRVCLFAAVMYTIINSRYTHQILHWQFPRILHNGPHSDSVPKFTRRIRNAQIVELLRDEGNMIRGVKNKIVPTNISNQYQCNLPNSLFLFSSDIIVK